MKVKTRQQLRSRTTAVEPAGDRLTVFSPTAPDNLEAAKLSTLRISEIALLASVDC